MFTKSEAYNKKFEMKPSPLVAWSTHRYMFGTREPKLETYATMKTEQKWSLNEWEILKLFRCPKING